MKIRYFVPLAAIGTAMLLAACGDSSDSETIALVEHADTDTVRHIGPASEEDSVGDVLAFANPVFDEANKEQIGTDNGSCIRTAVGKAWECIWTLKLSEGQLTVEGPFYDGGKDSQLAINLMAVEVLLAGTGMPDLYAQAIAVATAMPFNFLGNKLWTFA
jgi:hypothetical protein